MRLGLQELEWGYIAAKLARAGDDEQSEFLKAFVKECLSWGTNYEVEKQLAGVNHLLTYAEKDVLSMITYKPED